MVDAFISKPSFWAPGFLAGLALFLEEPRRRAELAMYVLPKGLESVWTMARGRGYVYGLGSAGEALLTAIGMGMVMATYQVWKCCPIRRRGGMLTAGDTADRTTRSTCRVSYGRSFISS